MSNANDGAKTASTEDSQSAVGTCSLKKNKLQLIPVRYGLVESLNASEQTEIPFNTESKPLGIRLLRNGYIYIVVNSDDNWILHEYKVTNGLIEKLLWQGSEVTSDERTSSVGAAQLIFERSSILYCAYSEVQWTARKCSQVIGSDKDRQFFMQYVNLCSFDLSDGGKDLLTPKQASELIAECTEQKIVTSEEYQYKPYEWEHKKLFEKVSFKAVSGKVLPDYQKDCLYLVFNDDVGVLRDLASYQALVADSIETWQSDEKRYQKYVEGCYIETQLQISPTKVDNLALALGDESFVSELNETQKNAIVDWIQEYDDKYDDFTRPSVGEKYRLMEEALGPEKMARYEDLIHDIQGEFSDEQQGVSLWRVWDADFGTKGIKDLIHQEEMELFLEQERRVLSYWNRVLKVISQDRTNLFDRFYSAAWYYDPTSKEQLEEYLAAEYSCIQDICLNDEASKLVANKLEQMPWVSTYRAMFTLKLDEYDKLVGEIGKKIKEIRSIVNYEKNIAAVNDIAVQLNKAVDENLGFHQTIQLDYNLNRYSQLIDSSYTPANTLKLTDTIDEFFNKVKNIEEFNPANVFRNNSGAAWLGVLQAYKNSDVTLGFATPEEMDSFKALREEAEKLRKENVNLKNQIRQVWANHRKAGQSGKPDVAKLANLRKSNQVALSKLEVKIHEAISPFATGVAKGGFYLQGLNDAQRLDVKQLAEDLRSAKKVTVRGNIKVWDGLNAILAVLAVYNAAKSFHDEFRSSEKPDYLTLSRDTSAAIASVLGFAKGIREGLDKAAVNSVSHSKSIVKYGANLGRWTTALGGFAYLFSFGASSIRSYQAGRQLYEAIKTGNSQAVLKHSTDVVAEGALVIVNIYGVQRSALVGRMVFRADKAVRAAIWATEGSRLLGIGMRLNLIGLIVTGVQLGVTACINRYSLTQYMQWFQNSQWGKEPLEQSLQQSNEQLAKISSKPKISVEQLDKGKALIITIPGISINDMDQAGVEMSLYWLVDHRENKWEPWSEAISQQWRALSQVDEPLQIGLQIHQNEANAEHGLAVELYYYATPDSTEKTVVRYQTTSFNKTGLLGEVAMLKVKQTTVDNVIPLTSNHLIIEGA